MKRPFFTSALLAVPVMAAAQWTAPDTPAPRAAEPVQIRAAVTDPVGDNFNPGPDLTSFSAATDGVNLTFGMTFAGAIEPPPGTGGGNEVGGFIDIDVDQNGATGLPGGNVGVFCPAPPASFGPEFFVELFTFNPATNTADIVETAGFTVVGSATVTFAPTSMTIVVPNAVIGDDGIADVATVIGNIPAPTDCAPDGAVLASDFAQGLPEPTEVPALTAWGMAALILFAGMIGFVLLRRRMV
mgnify:CR=1 FL=1